MPHQRLIADVAGEVLPSGRMAYPVVVVIKPRRGGKTGLTLPTALQRARWTPRARCWYTAQTGQDAGFTFRKDWVERVETTVDKRYIKPRLSNGSESLDVMASRGSVGVFAPGPKALHGKEADWACVDEAWAFSALAGSQLETAIRPAMLTRRRRQLWIISAGGTVESEWLLKWRELGRALTGPDQGLAYFEWHPAVDAEGRITDDLEDPAVWAANHPAVGHTIDLADLIDDRKTFGEAEFRRSYLNVFSGTLADRVLPERAWNECRDELAQLVPGPGLSLSYAVAPDRSTGALVLAGRVDGRTVVELLPQQPGTSWMAPELARLRMTYGLTLVADAVGPHATVTRELADKGLTVEPLDSRAVVDACAELLDDILTHTDPTDPESPRRFAHRGQRPLDDAAALAAKRDVLDGWAWKQRASAGDISPLVAATNAAHHARHRIARAPDIYLPSA